jgi:hypothetical protein
VVSHVLLVLDSRVQRSQQGCQVDTQLECLDPRNGQFDPRSVPP